MEGSLVSKRIYLLNKEKFEYKDFSFVEKLFTHVKDIPIHSQIWEKGDVFFLLKHTKNFFLIKTKDDLPIGYISLSNKSTFELYIVKSYQLKGHSVEASLLFLSYVFFSQDVGIMNTLIHKSNLISIKSATNFGWEYMGERTSKEEWLKFILRKEIFIKKKVLLFIAKKYDISNYFRAKEK